MKKKFLAALFTVAAVLGLVGAASASSGAPANNTVTLEPSKLVLEKVKMSVVDPTVDVNSPDNADVWIVKSIGTYAGQVEIPATYPYTDPVTNNTDYLDVVAIGAVSSSLSTNEYPAFRGSSIKGVKIPETVVKIGRQAFANSDSLTSVVIPKNITDIGVEAFLSCDNLKDITFEDNIDFDTKESLSTLTIGASAFEKCGLTTVDLPQHDTILGDRAFYDCNNLATVLIWNIKEFSEPTAGGAGWSSWAFADCENLKTIIVSGNVKGIPNDAFDIPASVPADPKDVPVFHYWMQGNDLEGKLFDSAPVSGTVEIHSLSLMEKKEIAATCESTGESYRDIKCPSNDLPSDIKRSKTLPLSEHAYYVPLDKANDVDYQKQLTDWKTEYDLKPCETFEWEYETECTRCSAEGTTTEKFEDALDHNWDLKESVVSANIDGALLREYPDELLFSKILTDTFLNNPDNDGLGEIKIDELVLPTCANEKTGDGDGYVKWTATCTYGCKTTDDTKKVDLLQSKYVPTGHTYTEGNVYKVTIEPTCLYEGVEVYYLTCDGDSNGKHPDGRVECKTAGSGSMTKCEELQKAIKDTLDELTENAKKAATAAKDAADLKKTESERQQAEQDLARYQALLDGQNGLRQKYKDAVDAYISHLAGEHTPLGLSGEKADISKLQNPAAPEECFVDKTELRNAGTGHTTDCIVTTEAMLALDGSDDYDCTEGGWKITETTCYFCGHTDDPPKKKDIGPHNHTVDPFWIDEDKSTSATCTEYGIIAYKENENAKCTECGVSVSGQSFTDFDLPPKGHTWGDFVPAGGTMPEPYEDCRVKPVEGTITCTECGETQDTEIKLPGKSGHTWGEWKVTTPAAPGQDGEETRTCLIPDCGETETRVLKYTEPEPGGDPGDTPDGDPGPSGPTTPTPDPNAEYAITVSNDGNGSVRTTPSGSAKAGASITITIVANSGYEFDLLRVTSDTAVVSTTSLGGGQYRFTMPASSVKVGVTFSPVASSAGSNWTGSGSSSSSSSSSSQTVVQSIPQASAAGQQLFRDIPATHWAAGEINWANQMGYMNGSNGSFNPNGIISHQQLWMILARLTGNNPSNMADAQRWAANGGFADGSAPEGSVNRHQLVTALYRCAHLMGTSNRSTAPLTGFPDSRLIPAVAREPFAWAIANGIIGGSADGRLDPNGTLTRAQFAVILYRFSQRV